MFTKTSYAIRVCILAWIAQTTSGAMPITNIAAAALLVAQVSAIELVGESAEEVKQTLLIAKDPWDKTKYDKETY